MVLDWLRRHLLALLLFTAALVFTAAFLRLPGLAVDDAFIHRRIALNFVHNGHPYFNPGQRVMATSSPLWTMLLALGALLLHGGNPAPALEFIFTLAGSAAAFLLVRESLEQDRWSASLFPAIAFVYVFLGNFFIAVEQMETPCALALILAGLLGVSRNRSWGLPLLVLACFARYECVLLVLLALLWTSWLRHWTKASLLGSTLTGTLGIGWLLYQFHTLIPNSAVAKSHAYSLSAKVVARTFVVSISSGALCILVGLVWCIVARNRARNAAPASLLLSVFGLLLAFAYIGARSLVFPWYLPLVLVPLAMGVLCWTSHSRAWQEVTGVAFAGLLLLPCLVADAGELHAALRNSPGSTRDYASIARVHEYQRIGAALYTVCPTATLMSSEIGGLGFEFHGTLLDGLGLASPEAIPYHPIPVPGGPANRNAMGIMSGIPAGYVRDFHPDLIVSYDIFAGPALPVVASLHYTALSFPLFPREDRPHASSLWNAKQMLAFVSPTAPCSAEAVQQAVSAALER